MTSAADIGFQTVAFGDVEAGWWGVAVSAGGGGVTLVLGAGGETAALEGSLHGSAADEEWRVFAEGAELVVTAVGEPVAAEGPEPAGHGFDQLCRVAGRFSVSGQDQDVTSAGVRGARDGGLRGANGFESVREVAVWFEPADGLALTAFRPAGAKGQDGDVISAAVLDAESWAPVEDPRLSTTYAGDGWASRAGLELWLAADEDQQELRRAAGEAVGARASAVAGDLELRAELFRWHSRGRDGTGVYVLTTRR
jgi:hypothetical protein